MVKDKMDKDIIIKKAKEYLRESLTCCIVRRNNEDYKDPYEDWINDLSRQINELEDEDICINCGHKKLHHFTTNARQEECNYHYESNKGRCKCKEFSI